LILKMHLLPLKHIEFVQTTVDLIGHARNNKACLEAEIYRTVDDENNLCILYTWDTVKDLKRYLKSDHYKVLKWAICDMTKSSTVQVCSAEI
jgi:quinol monooxygenase YgiN